MVEPWYVRELIVLRNREVLEREVIKQLLMNPS